MPSSVNSMVDKKRTGQIAKVGRPSFRLPVVILVGGAAGQSMASTTAARRLLVEGFSRYSGTVISGGTISGIAGIAGDIAAANAQIVAVGYLPRMLPPGVERDKRYARFRTTQARIFSVRECLAYWEDLLGAGVEPAAVKVLGWGGGKIAALEYRIAAALEAKVGLIEGSGRAADKIAHGSQGKQVAGIQYIRATGLAVREFLDSS